MDRRERNEKQIRMHMKEGDDYVDGSDNLNSFDSRIVSKDLSWFTDSQIAQIRGEIIYDKWKGRCSIREWGEARKRVYWLSEDDGDNDC